jgi:hypothetical protein
VPPELVDQFLQLDERGAHTERLMAKRLIRICKSVVLSGAIYRPKALLDEKTPKEALAAHVQAAWPKLVTKWKTTADLALVFSPKHPLGQWRDLARELYGLELPLPKRRGHARPAATP